MDHPAAIRPSIDTVQTALDGSSITHELIPPTRQRRQASVAAAHSIAFVFTRSGNAVVRGESGVARRMAMRPGGVAFEGGLPTSWLETDAEVDFLEIRGSPVLRAEVADEFGAARHAGLAQMHDVRDPVLLGIGLRLRGACRGGRPATPLEIDTLVRALYGRALVVRFGGTVPTRTHRIGEQRMARVVERLAEPTTPAPTVAELASLASMTPWHFLRSFRRTVGLTPHHLQTLLALERGRNGLARGLPMTKAAEAAGFENVRWFRRLLRVHEGGLHGCGRRAG